MTRHLLIGILILAALALAPTLARAQDEPFEEKLVEDFIEELAEAYRSEGGEKIAEMIDVPTMWKAIMASSELTTLTPEQEAAVQMGLGIGLRMQAAQWSQVMAWERHEILRLKLSPDCQRAVVMMREWDAAGISLVIRWWLVKTEAGWKFYDFEDLSTSLRASLLMATGLSAIFSGEGQDWVESARKLVQASAFLSMDDQVSAAELAEEIRNEPLPGAFEALKELLFASLAIWELDDETALTHLAGARELQPDMPILDYLESVARNLRGEHELALAAARRFVALLGSDPDGSLEVGRSLLLLGRRGEAVAAFAEGLAIDPEGLELLAGYGAALPPGGKDEFANRFATIKDAPAVFEDLILELQGWEDPEAERVLIARLRQIAPKDPNADYYEADLLNRDGEYGKAADLLRGALSRAPEDEKDAYVDSWLENMAQAGRHLEAYDTLKTPGAFEFLAEYLYGESNELLLKLVEAHEATGAADHQTAFHKGEAFSALERFEEAEAAYLVAMERDPGFDEEFTESLRESRLWNFNESGDPLGGFLKVGPDRYSFSRLAQWLSWEEDAETLEKLISLHAGEDPEDPWLIVHRAEVHWLRGEFEECVKTLLADEEKIRDLPDFYHENRLVRGLIELERFDEALKVAKTSTAEDDDPWFEALVYAARGDAEALDRTFAALVALEFYDTSDFYGEPLIEKALGTEKFAPLREKYPPPE